MLDCLCKEDSSKIVGTALSLKLSFWLVFIPRFDKSIPYEEIQGFCHHLTRRNCAIRFGRRSVFVVPFEENTGINGINLSDGRAIDIAGEVIEEEVEVSQPAGPAKL